MTRPNVQSSVPAETRRLGNLVFRHRSFWAAMGRLESSFLRERLDRIQIEKPIYITGLARSGTTILLEMIAAHSCTATHRYKDFPMLYTPYWWNWFLARAAGRQHELSERTHQDGIKVGPDSPEAMEEPLWMHFFDHLHDPHRSNVLDTKTDHPAFEQFYADHIRKLLLARKGQRYAAKGNYNLARIEYLLKQFPDARFVVPVRDPVAHIASLRKQHRLFETLERDDPPVLEHMCRVGHYEFGLNWAPVNYADTAMIDRILSAWNDGRDIEAWALYWNHVHRYLLEQLRKPGVGEAVLVVGYEKLCSESEACLEAILKHCALEKEQSLIEEFSGKLVLPTYYTHGLSDEEVQLITDLTGDVAGQLGLI